METNYFEELVEFYNTLLEKGVLNSFKLVNATMKLDETNYRLDLVTKSFNFDETIVTDNPNEESYFLEQISDYLQIDFQNISEENPIINRYNYYKFNIEILDNNECNLSLSFKRKLPLIVPNLYGRVLNLKFVRVTLPSTSISLSLLIW